MNKTISSLVIFSSLVIAASSAFADDHRDDRHKSRSQCKDVPTYSELKAAIDASGATDKNLNGGFGLNMWATVVNREGYVCAVAFTGNVLGDQWPGSRAISAAKAYTGNAYSLPGFALSTANLYASGQPGGSLWGLQFSNPVNPELTAGNPKKFGKKNDPMVGKKVGGQIVFGGGFGLYNENLELVGGLGVSGDTSCKDHNFGWRVRHELNMDFVPAGVGSAGVTGADPSRPDNIIYDMGAASQGGTVSPSAWGHVDCGLGEAAISQTLPATQ